MLDDYERLQGVVLRQIVIGASSPIGIAPAHAHGRISAFTVNEHVCVFVKHSTKRMSPWSFTFHRSQQTEISRMRIQHDQMFVAFVCGSDGVVTLEFNGLCELMSFDGTDQAWIRIERKPREMYGLSGNHGEFQRKIAQGVGPIREALQNANNMRFHYVAS